MDGLVLPGLGAEPVRVVLGDVLLQSVEAGRADRVVAVRGWGVGGDDDSAEG